ncbi:MAG: hypothetical protein A3K19_13500 [Lentisphaerae bacterium RIFOXYB12_FULL_65_16]|nr:MAG: hypothetical protein A3K18_29020 [Lentisphaerae bacterium RIFOXYA12_64_32]OGV86319.1 MAG: hypothetical protein A3K19_13500 [Lentisphaerae bacterium RIFOXYB12_FULL_65_16]
MKSAFDRAMERFGGEASNCTPEQKKQLSEIDKLYDAKVAQAKFEGEQRLAKAADDAEKLERVRDEIAIEIASFNRKRETEKEKVRQKK